MVKVRRNGGKTFGSTTGSHAEPILADLGTRAGEDGSEALWVTALVTSCNPRCRRLFGQLCSRALSRPS
ncbi:MAG: hypothetical protein QOI57_898 [Rubrobacteraceae bacterium]|nr:hypothetical protein [Rubrobacteraceae bacterium]